MFVFMEEPRLSLILSWLICLVWELWVTVNSQRTEVLQPSLTSENIFEVLKILSSNYLKNSSPVDTTVLRQIKIVFVTIF